MNTILLCLALLVPCLVQRSGGVVREKRQTPEPPSVSTPSLLVEEVPVAEVEDVDSTQLIGSRFSVLCSGYGNPPPDVYWSRKSGGHLPHCARDINGVLIVTNFTSECTGVFVCNAVNRLGASTAQIDLRAVESPPPPTEPPCEFRCGLTEESVCVPSTSVCNGSRECLNGEDEANCKIVETTCRPDEVLCDGGKCVSMSKRCDGIQDCGDGVDEEDCSASSGEPCLASQFACGRSPPVCIPLRQRCDGAFQCDNRDDEKGCEKPLGITGPPRGPLEVNVGSRVKLTCTAGGTPPPFITWRHNCGPLPRDARYMITSIGGRGQLIINNVTTRDVGRYSCEMVSIFGRQQIFHTTEIFVQDPLAYRCEDEDGVPYEAGTKYYVKKTVESGLGARDAADVIFVMDESGSMLEEHLWLKKAVVKLDEALKEVNIGNITNPNQFGLVGFSRDSDSARGGVVIQNLTTPTSFIRSVDHLQLSGVHEDGYSAISIALKTMKVRPSTAKLVILVTDEDRDILNFQLDRDAVTRLLKEKGFKLTVLVQQSYVAEHYGDRLSGFVLGIDSSLKAYVLDTNAVDDYIVAQQGIPIPGTGFGTTYHDYVELALDTGGSAWDLQKIREGEPVLTAFTNAFVRVAAEDTLSTFESCFQCDCVLPEPDCTMSVTDIERCRGAVNPLPLPPYVCIYPSSVIPEANTTVALYCDIHTRDPSDELEPIDWTYPDGVVPLITARKQLLRVRGTDTSIGNYTCVVRTSKGLTVSALAQLKYPDIPGIGQENEQILAGPQVTLSKKSTSAAIGDDVELDCSVTGYPPPHVSWSREDGRALPSNSLITKKKGKHVWTLVLSIGADSYYGNYQCTAVNFLSSSTAVASVEKA